MNEEKNVINGGLTDQQPSEGEPQTQEFEEAVEEGAENTEDSAKPEPGSKTDPALLLKDLKKEKEKRRLLEEELKELKGKKEKDSEEYEEDEAEEESSLKKKITSVEKELTMLKESQELERVVALYPVIKDKKDDFLTFREENYPDIKLETVAKVYLAENGFFDPVRKGLEQPTGGDKTAPKGGMTSDDVKNLRETNYRKYTQMLSEGKIKITS